MWETAGDSEVESSRDSAPVPGAIVNAASEEVARATLRTLVGPKKG